MVLTDREKDWDERFGALVRRFDRTNHESARALRALLTEDPTRFLHSAASLLSEAAESEAHRFVAMLVARNEYALPLLTNSEILSLDSAIAAARRLLPFEPALERKLVKALHSESGTACDRMLNIVAAITPPEHVEAVLSPLVQHADPNIRAAVIPVLTRCTGSLRWALSNVTQADPRTRASAIRALWDVKSGPVQAVMHRAASDTHPAVAASALIGVYRLGDNAALSALELMSCHADPLFRAAAADAMCATADARFAPTLKRLLQDQEPAVRSQAIRSLARLKRSRAPQSAGKLQIRVLRTAKAGHQLTVWFQVLTEEGERIANLAPVQLALWDGARPLMQYTVSNTGGPGRLAVGFGLWRSRTLSEAFWAAAEQGLDACLDLKSPVHTWSVVKVSKPEEDLGGALELPPHESLLTQPDPMLDTAIALIITASRNTASRHVILLVHPDSADADQVIAIIDAALRHEVSVHVIAPAPVPDSHPLRQFEELPASSLRIANTPEELASAYQEVYKSLLVCYAATFPVAGPDEPHDFRIEVDCEQGSGVQGLTFTQGHCEDADGTT